TVKWGHPTLEAGKKIFAVLDHYEGRPARPGSRLASGRPLFRGALRSRPRLGMSANRRQAQLARHCRALVGELSAGCVEADDRRCGGGRAARAAAAPSRRTGPEGPSRLTSEFVKVESRGGAVG